MEEKNHPAIMIAAIKSGSGKTAFTCALLKALKDRGLHPCAFKCGPDYIDPKFHQKVLGVPSENLDSFFSGEEHLKNLYGRSSKKGGISVIEGAMGLFDGLGGISESGSAYKMASLLKIPVILVIDAHGMGRSMIPLLAGFLSYDKEKLIKGVILNKISDHFFKTIAPVVEEELGLPVLGYLPKDPAFVMESRHLGLKLPDEIKSIREQMEQGAAIIEKSILMDRLLKIAKNAGEIEEGKKEREQEPKIKLAVARDEAFCFYYEENLRILRQKGAELLYFSPVHDEKLPKDVDALLLGGGYPELYAKELENNESMRTSIREAIKKGMPSLAECGGFMYLHDSIWINEKEKYKMCQILPDSCYNKGRLGRFGYITLSEKRAEFLEPGSVIKAHEFHYYDSEKNGSDCVAIKPVTGRTWECVMEGRNHFWGFPHLYYASNPGFVEHFIEAAGRYKIKRNKEV